jgi:probable regulatory domain-containing protein
MSPEIEPVTVQADDMVRAVLLKALEVAGGLRKLVEYRNLTWVPALIEAAYVVVLHEEFKKSEDEIASFLGVSSITVRNILRASPEGVQERLEAERGERELRTHVAGGLAKLAYRELKQSGQLPG